MFFLKKTSCGLAAVTVVVVGTPFSAGCSGDQDDASRCLSSFCHLTGELHEFSFISSASGSLHTNCSGTHIYRN